MIKDNEKRAEYKKIKKEQEKIDNKKALDLYTELIEKQERERLEKLHNKNTKLNYDFEIQTQIAKKTDEILKLYEENKFNKEKEELEIK